MLRIFKASADLKQVVFLRSDDGAVTIDWVLLTALVVGLATAALFGFDAAVADLMARLVDYLDSLI